MTAKRIIAAILTAVMVIVAVPPLTEAQAATDWSKYSSNYFYKKMNKNEKKLYSNMSKSAKRVMTTNSKYTRVSAKFSDMTLDNVSDVLKIWKETEAQYFFVGSEIGYSFSGYSEYGKQSGTAYVNIMKSYQSGSARKKAKQKFQKTISSMLKKASKGKTMAAKEKIIHDALAKRLTWDDTDQYNKQSSASSLIGKNTVCAGYSAAFSVLMNALGAQTISITSSSHEWNEIYLNGHWYNVDVTFDDPQMNGGTNNYPDGSNIQHKYFNVSDDTLRSDNYSHIPDYMWDNYGRPVCRMDR